MSDKPTRSPEPEGDPEFPPELQEALRNMSKRGRVVDGSGKTVAEEGRLVTDDPPPGLRACNECARAVALGWWGGIARHAGDRNRPVCVLCGEGEAVHTAEAWFDVVFALAKARTKDGQRRTWRYDAAIGLGAFRGGENY